MTAKVVRIIMILLTVFIASIVLPDFYKTSFKRNVKYVSLNYSEVTKQFVIWGLKDGVLLDTLGNEYSRQEYERMVPFSSMPQLLKRNEFPDTVAGVEKVFKKQCEAILPAAHNSVYKRSRCADDFLVSMQRVVAQHFLV